MIKRWVPRTTEEVAAYATGLCHAEVFSRDQGGGPLSGVRQQCQRQHTLMRAFPVCAMHARLDDKHKASVAAGKQRMQDFVTTADRRDALVERGIKCSTASSADGPGRLLIHADDLERLVALIPTEEQLAIMERTPGWRIGPECDAIDEIHNFIERIRAWRKKP